MDTVSGQDDEWANAEEIILENGDVIRYCCCDNPEHDAYILATVALPPEPMASMMSAQNLLPAIPFALVREGCWTRINDGKGEGLWGMILGAAVHASSITQIHKVRES